MQPSVLLGHGSDTQGLCPAVIRAKVVSGKEVDSGNDIYGNPIKRTQYEIKQIKVGARRGGGRVGPGALPLFCEHLKS